SGGTLDALIVAISGAFSVVGGLIAPDNGNDLLTQLGYKVPGGSNLPALFTDITTKTTALTNSLNAVVAGYNEGTSEDPSLLEKVVNLAKAVTDMGEAAQGLISRANTAF